METHSEHTSHLKLNGATVRGLLVDFIRDGLHTSGFEKGIVGVSGGVDSAVAATLAVEALGKDNVLAVFLPYRSSSPESLADGKILVDGLGIRSETVDISAMVDGYITRHSVTDPLRAGTDQEVARCCCRRAKCNAVDFCHGRIRVGSRQIAACSAGGRSPAAATNRD